MSSDNGSANVHGVESNDCTSVRTHSKHTKSSNVEKRHKKKKSKCKSHKRSHSPRSSSADKHKKKNKSKKHKKQKRQSPNLSEDDEVPGPALPKDFPSRSTLMKPMSKEEWEQKQNSLRHITDPVTGRRRLIRGDGEILEEIVSKQQHELINRQATIGDGTYFQKIVHDM